MVTGEKTKQIYDPTQRRTRVNPDVDALVLGHGREVPGEAFERCITWVGPSGGTRLIKKLKIPTHAEQQDLMCRIAYALDFKELD